MYSNYHSYIEILNSAVSSWQADQQKQFFDHKKQIFQSLGFLDNTDCWTQYHSRMGFCFTTSQQNRTLMIPDEFFCFESAADVLEIGYKKIVTTLSDYKNLPFYLKDFSLPNRLGDKWFLERYDTRSNRWILETNVHAIAHKHYKKSLIQYKQLAHVAKQCGYSLQVLNKQAYKNPIRRNFESIVVLEKL